MRYGIGLARTPSLQQVNQLPNGTTMSGKRATGWLRVTSKAEKAGWPGQVEAVGEEERTTPCPVSTWGSTALTTVD